MTTTSTDHATSSTPTEGHWQTRARCRDEDPELFFPLPGESTDPAKAVCQRCPVRDACLAWALSTNLRHGVAGGLSAPERETILRKNHQAAVAELVA